jgi:hypothetical protein
MNSGSGAGGGGAGVEAGWELSVFFLFENRFLKMLMEYHPQYYIRLG